MIGQKQNDMNEVELPSTKQRVGNYVAYVALVLTMLAVGVLLYWAFQPSDVLEIKNSPFPVRTIREHPTADGVIILNIDYCKKIDVEGKVRISFVSQSREVFLPIADDRQSPTCKVVEFPVLIPHELPKDKYRIKFRTEYRVNPLKTEVEEFESRSFEVVDGSVSNAE